MNSDIITSKGEALLGYTQLILLHITLVVISIVTKWPLLRIASLLIWGAVFIKKDLRIDIELRKFKDGFFIRWKDLPQEGYVSVLRKVNPSSKKVDREGLKVLYVRDKKQVQIYGPKSLNDAIETALLLGEAWNCGVYQAHTKSWLRDK